VRAIRRACLIRVNSRSSRGVDRHGRPRALRELTLIRHALRIARTRRVGECRSADPGPRPVLDFGAAPTSRMLFPLVTNPGSPTWSTASRHRTAPLRIPVARPRAIVFDLSPDELRRNTYGPAHVVPVRANPEGGPGRRRGGQPPTAAPRRIHPQAGTGDLHVAAAGTGRA